MYVFIKHQPGPRNTWSEHEYTIHIAHAGRTLCRNGQPDAPADGRLSPRGWRQTRLPAQSISCKACLHLLDRDAIESTLAERSATLALPGATPPLA
jgi:hypothetical protein